MKNFLLLLVLMVTVSSLKAQVPVHAAPDSAWMDLYRGTPDKINDLVHTRLEVKFNYEKSYMYGKVWITLQPHFYTTDSLALDAKGMDIHKVLLVNNKQELPLKYNYDGMMIRIKLNKIYKKGEKYTVYIDYTARPDELKVTGSAAISDAKGLYFINPRGEDTGKPTQIWTQGETEATSVWCPTIDNPAQKTTQEIFMTVPAKYVTLSNGKLVSQKVNADKTRTDHWKMDLPHSPYLFFMGVGEYAVVKDSYKGKEVNYYVEKEYEKVARKIFGHTPEMMAFFEQITGVPYPWNKYSQIVGRDYVSGAMENTTATLHQESAQQDARQLVDGNAWESVIAHELFHQWFGDYVTTESWSNLTVNESFANFSEMLWFTHKYGKDAGDEQNFNEMQGYLNSQSEHKDLVRFYYRDKEDMFDAVSYNKGGRILNMLRNYLGDSAFFKGIGLYLTTNKFKTGEAHQLRLALEEVSGRDLNWFFNQWYFGNGHPELDISYSYDEANRKVSVSIKQIPTGSTLFELPVAIDIYNGAKKVRHQVWIRDMDQTFTFSYDTKPDLVNVDGDKVLLCEKKDDKTLENFIHQYKYAGLYLDRREAIDACVQYGTRPEAVELLKTALKDKYHGLREYTISKIDLKNPALKQAVEPVIADLAKNDPKSTVRGAAIGLLSQYHNADYLPVFLSAINDSSYTVAGNALEALALLDESAAQVRADSIKKTPVKGKLAAVLLDILIKEGNENDFTIIAGNFEALPLGQEKFETLAPFSVFLSQINDTDRFKKGIDLIISFRDAIPAAYRAETSAFINNMVLNGILAAKNKQASGDNASAVKQQIEYLQSKL